MMRILQVLIAICVVALVGCSQKSTMDNTITLGEKNNPTYDASSLDRSLITWPIDYADCVAMSGYVYNWYDSLRCKLGGVEHLKSENHNNGSKTYALDNDINHVLGVMMPLVPYDAERDDLVEGLAQGLTGRELAGGDIFQPNKSYIHSKSPLIRVHHTQGETRKITAHMSGTSIMFALSESVEYPYTIQGVKDGKEYVPIHFREEDGEYRLELKDNPMRLGNHTITLLEKERGTQNTKTIATISLENVGYRHLGRDHEYCIREICFDPNLPIYRYKSRLVQYEGSERDHDITMTIYHMPTHTYVQYRVGMMLMQTTAGGYRDNSNYRMSHTQGGCGGGGIERMYTGALTTPGSFSLLGKTYRHDSSYRSLPLGHDHSNQYGYMYILPTIYEANNVQAVRDDVMRQVDDDGSLYHTYAMRFDDRPGIYEVYSYQGPDQQPNLVVTGVSIDGKTDKEGNIHDLAFSQKIFCDAGKHEGELEEICGPRETMDSQGIGSRTHISQKRTQELTVIKGEESYQNKYARDQKLMPLRKVVGQYSGYVMLATTEGVEFSDGAAGCKPVVYVYDQKNRSNELTVTLPEGSYFTKLIPDFTSSQTRSFTADADGHIQLSGQTYPYLYYATQRKDYHHNPHGRVVAGDDIAHFLNDKLTKMNFNAQEKADFLEYWVPEFTSDHHYFISFKYADDLEGYAKLDFAIAPHKSFRMFMEARQLPVTHRVTYDPEYPDRGDDVLIQSFERGSELDMLERGGHIM